MSENENRIDGCGCVRVKQEDQMRKGRENEIWKREKFKIKEHLRNSERKLKLRNTWGIVCKYNTVEASKNICINEGDLSFIAK